MRHTWPYESDHRFRPAVRHRPHDSVTRRHWLELGEDLALRAPVVVGLIARVAEGVGLLCDDVDAEQLGMPEPWVRDVRRRIRRRLRDLQ